MRKTEIGLQTSNGEWMREALHDLCQPLTALECGLYIGTMSPDGVRTPTADELLATIVEALRQCERVTARLRAIQDRLNSEG
jgi:hypothetical protein